MRKGLDCVSREHLPTQEAGDGKEPAMEGSGRRTFQAEGADSTASLSEKEEEDLGGCQD